MCYLQTCGVVNWCHCLSFVTRRCSSRCRSVARVFAEIRHFSRINNINIKIKAFYCLFWLFISIDSGFAAHFFCYFFFYFNFLFAQLQNSKTILAYISIFYSIHFKHKKEQICFYFRWNKIF